jgi:hypothetical protein
MFAVPEHTVLQVSPQRQSGIATMLRRAAADGQHWQGQLRWHPDRPVRLSLPAVDEGVHAWLTGWPPGVDAAALNPAQGAFTVVSGLVMEQAGGSSRVLPPGRMRVFGPGYRHLLGNPFAVRAVTVHVELHA